MFSFLKGTDRKTGGLFIASTWFLYCGGSCVHPHLTRFYDIDLHLQDWQIGTLMALPSLGSMLAQPLWGFLADRLIGRARTYRLVLILLAVLLPLFTSAFFAGGYGLLVAAAFVLMTVYGATSPLSSSLILSFLGTGRRQYFGKIRSIGSLSFMLTMFLLCPPLVAWSLRDGQPGRAYVFYAASLFYLLALACSFWDERHFQKHRRPEMHSFRELLRNPRLRVLYLTVFLSCTGAHAGIQYIGPYVSHRGLSETYYASLWLIGVGMEVLLTFNLHRVSSRIGLRNTIVMGSLAEGIRWLGMSLVTHPAWMQFFFAFHGPAVMGIFFASAMFVDTECDESIRSTAQAVLYVSVVLGQVTGYMGGSLVVSAYHDLARDLAIRSGFFWFGLTALLSAILFLLSSRVQPSKAA